jgi:hypothetical protein
MGQSAHHMIPAGSLNHADELEIGSSSCLVPSWVPFEIVPGLMSSEEWLARHFRIRPDGSPIERPIRAPLTHLPTLSMEKHDVVLA